MHRPLGTPPASGAARRDGMGGRVRPHVAQFPLAFALAFRYTDQTMKVREVRFSHIRGFGEALRRVTFFDPDTDQVRPLSVLVGSNGCGKTTVLQLIESSIGLLALGSPDRRTQSLMSSGYAAVQWEPEFLSTPASLLPRFWFSIAREDLVPSTQGDLANHVWFRSRRADGGQSWSAAADAYKDWLLGRYQTAPNPIGGLLYFPHDRWFEQPEQGGISEPEMRKKWLFHFRPHSQWQGSLAQLWVWQNYLDLEAGREGRPNLLPFVELIEEILGRGRRVVIHKARVHVQDGDRRVELHELPSGEQQILALFGEIIRQIRPGAVILIDEIEISLHPALQRAVLAHLRNLARKYDLQIIVTTHSMDIVHSVSPREIVNMDDMIQTEQSHGA